MILFYTPNSPYARTARIALREWNVLGQAEERPAANRATNNPVLAFSPVGRVPTLVHGDLIITEARNVFAYIKDLASAEVRERNAEIHWKEVAEEGQIASFLEGVASWVREVRAREERSDFFLAVEQDRMLRCLDFLNNLATARPQPAVSEFRGAALASALDLMEMHCFCPDWKQKNRDLAAWFGSQLDRRSLREMAPRM